MGNSAFLSHDFIVAVKKADARPIHICSMQPNDPNECTDLVCVAKLKVRAALDVTTWGHHWLKKT